MTTGPVILCMNSGSSSLKFALYQLGEAAEIALAAGAVERVGLPGGSLWSHADVISASESRCTVRVVPTNEDLMIVRHTRRLLFSTFPPASDATTEEALR